MKPHGLRFFAARAQCNKQRHEMVFTGMGTQRVGGTLAVVPQGF